MQSFYKNENHRLKIKYTLNKIHKYAERCIWHTIPTVFVISYYVDIGYIMVFELYSAIRIQYQT